MPVETLRAVPENVGAVNGGVAFQHQKLSTKRQRRQPRRANPYATVPRPRLMRAVNDYLTRDGMLALCSERGMGRHILANDVSDRHRMLKGSVYSARMSGGSLEYAARRLHACVDECIELARTGASVLLVIEGVGSLGAKYAARVAHYVDMAVLNACKVLLIASPEAEMLFELLPTCHVMRSAELLLSEEEYVAWGNISAGYSSDLVVSVTHGIPSLVAALKETVPSAVGLPTGSSWDRAVMALMSDALRPGLIEEEQRLRCAMAALGRGKVSDLENLGIRASFDLIEDAELDAPLFGANARLGTFSMVPCEAALVAKAIETSIGAQDMFMASAIRSLAQAGNLGRAAALAAALEDTSELNQLVYQYPLELIDAGLIGLVLQVVGAHEQAPEASRALRALQAFGAKKPHLKRTRQAAPALASLEAAVEPKRHTLELQLELISMLSDKMKHRFEVASQEQAHFAACCAEGMAHENRATQVFSCLVHVLGHVLDGEVQLAFKELMLKQELRAQTSDSLSLFSAILQIVYEILRAVMSDSTTEQDYMQDKLAEFVLQKYAPDTLYKLVLGWRSVAYVFTGQQGGAENLLVLQSHYAHRAQKQMLSYVHLASALMSAAEGSYRQTHVHAGEAYANAVAAGAPDLVALAGLVECMVLFVVGEARAIKQLLTKGFPPKLGPISPDVKTLFLVYASLLMGRGNKQISEVMGKESELAPSIDRRPPRPEIYMFARYLIQIDKAHGKELADSLPATWRLSSRTRLVLAGIAGGGEARVRAVPVLPRPERPLLEEVDMHASQVPFETMRVRVFGGVSVAVGKEIVLESQWQRPQARTLLAYLALAPNHAMTRYELLNALWPDASFERGRERLYTTVSALRCSIGQTADTEQYVISEAGRIWLDQALVEFDIDIFENLSRSILCAGATHEAVVSDCLTLEKIYATGLFIPPKDTTGLFKRRQKECAERYESALEKGVSAARKLGDYHQMQWFQANIKALHQ